MNLNLKKNQNQQENQELQLTESPNLLYSSKKNLFEPIIEKKHIQIATIAKLTIILAQLVFAVLVGLNSSVAGRVSALEKDIKKLEIELIAKKGASEEVQTTIDKIGRLKKLQTSTPRLTNNITKAVNVIPNPKAITQVHIEPSSMQITTETDSPLEVSSLITAYFQNELTEEVTIKTASLSNATGKFITTLEVELK